MKNTFLTALFCLSCSLFCNAQTVDDFINSTNLPLLKLTVNELTGETTTKVNGSTVTIKNRVSASGAGNDIAADFIKERLTGYNLTAVDQIYKSGKLGGRNVYATQLGKKNPADIYMICAHYDAKADYCADDNISGVVALLEAARLLSNYCFENTIVYAFWDEEETGLEGSKYYAKDASSNKENIKGVLNLDMAAYDGNGDKGFDIDVNNNVSSLAIKDLLLSLVKTYKLDLIPTVVNPGTPDSDHAAFWPYNYGALLLGESWSTKDITPYYHTSKDRANTLNWPYYHEMVKLTIAYIATVANPLKTTVDVTQVGNTLTANTSASAYQWINCGELFTPIKGQTNKNFTATTNGNYAVQATIDGCKYLSSCFRVGVSGLNKYNSFTSELTLYPNPSATNFIIDLHKKYSNIQIDITDVNGKLKYSKKIMNSRVIPIEFKEIAGVYFISVVADENRGVLKLMTH
ncbi:MAG: M28 family peptidase [Bacteroidia bacterium]